MTTLLLLALIFVFCGTVGSRDPGIIKRATEEPIRLWHQNEVLGSRLNRKMNATSIPELSGNITNSFGSTIDYVLGNLELMQHSKPRAELSIRRSEGIWLTIHIASCFFTGKHKITVINEPLEPFTKQGNIDLNITGLTMTMKRHTFTFGSDSTMTRWESSEASAIIDNVKIDLHDKELHTYLAFVDTAQLNQKVCDHLLNAYKNLTEDYYDATLKLTDNLYVDMMVMRGPNLYDGYLEFFYPGEIRYKGDNRVFTDFPEGLQFDSQYPESELKFIVSEKIFNSLAFVIHNNGLLDCKYEKEDLPETSKHLLNTTCNSSCFGKQFAEVGTNYPGTSVDLIAVTTKSNFMTVNVHNENLRIYVELNITARVRGVNSTRPLFVVLYKMSSKVQPKIRKMARLNFEILSFNQSVDVLESSIGDLPHDKLLDFMELPLQKCLTPAVRKLKFDGIQIKLPISSLSLKSEIRLQPSKMILLFNTYTREANRC